MKRAPKHLYEIIDSLYNVTTPSWGQEVEYNPDHYSRNIYSNPTLKLIEEKIMSGMDDGSGPRELRSIPCNLFDFDCLRFNTTIITSILKIPFDKSTRYSYGRHIHMRFANWNNSDIASEIHAKNLQFALLLFTPFNGWVEDFGNNYIVVRFREELPRWATPFTSFNDHYYFASISRHHTLENRLNEKHLSESYVSVLGFYTIYMTYSPFKIKIEKLRGADTIILKDGNTPIAKWESNVVVVKTDAFTKVMRDVMAYIGDIASKKILRHVQNVYKNTMKKEEISKPEDVEALYPYLLIN